MIGKYFKIDIKRLFQSIQARLKYVAKNQTNTKLLEKQTELGFKYNPYSWLQDEGLDVDAMAVIAFDVMHCWCQGVYGRSNWKLSWTSCLNMGMEVVSCMHTCNDSCGQGLM